jgi:predicted Zn-dependent protease
MTKLRLIILAILLAAGAGLVVLLVIVKPKTPLEYTFAPAFQLLGRGTKTLDRALTRLTPVNEADEAEFGEAIAQRYETEADRTGPEGKYLNAILGELSRHARKPFKYRAFIIEGDPNAFALPGGVIIATRGLLATVKSEAELAAILAHEMGHVELSHCFDAVRYELLSRKTGRRTLCQLADFSVNLMLRHSFSKTQEEEADRYAYDLILETEYTPSCVGDSFKSFLAWEKKAGVNTEPDRGNVVRDYFMTHPETVLRAEKFTEEARRWWRAHPGEKKYRGVKNLRLRVPAEEKRFDAEYVRAHA